MVKQPVVLMCFTLLLFYYLLHFKNQRLLGQRTPNLLSGLQVLFSNLIMEHVNQLVI